MRLPLNWLKEFVDLPVTPEVLADRLTLAGFEVEGIEAVNPDFSGVVVARAVRVDPHPNADRLTVVEVEDGSRSPACMALNQGENFSTRGVRQCAR